MKKKSIAVFILTFMLFICVLDFIFRIFMPVKSNSSVIVSSSDRYVYDLSNNSYLEQTFISKTDCLRKIGVQVLTYGKTILNGVVVLEVYDSSDKQIAIQSYEAKDILDNSFLWISFDPIKNSKNQQFKIKISSDKFSEDKLGVWLILKQNETTILSDKNNSISMEMSYRYVGKDSNYSFLWYPTMLFFILLVSLSFFDKGDLYDVFKK